MLEAVLESFNCAFSPHFYDENGKFNHSFLDGNALVGKGIQEELITQYSHSKK